MFRRILVTGAIFALSATSASAASNITHSQALRVDRQHERTFGGQVVGCKVLRSHRRAVCSVVDAQYAWQDVVTRDGGCTFTGGGWAIHGRNNCYTGPVVALPVAYSITLRPNYTGPEIGVLR